MLCRLNSRALALTLLSLTLLLAGCGSVSTPSSPPPEVVPPAKVPRLAQQARQPTTPPECAKGCLRTLADLLDAMLPSPTSEAPQAEPAKQPTTR